MDNYTIEIMIKVAGLVAFGSMIAATLFELGDLRKTRNAALALSALVMSFTAGYLAVELLAPVAA